MLMRPVRAVFNERMKLYRGVGRVAFTGARNSYIYSYTTLFNLLYALHDIGVAVETQKSQTAKNDQGLLEAT